MKKVLVIFLFCLVGSSAFSQLRVGIEGGFNIAQFADRGSDQQYYNLSGIGAISAGIVAEKFWKKNYYFSTGILFIQKGGYKEKGQYATYGSSTTTRLKYIQVPFNIIYKWDIGKNMKLMAGAGLYMALGISGTEKGVDESITGAVTKIDNRVRFTYYNVYNNTETYIKPLDIGYNLLGGIEWKKYQFKLNYSHGFGSIYPIGSTKFSNAVYGISVGYLLPW